MLSGECWELVGGSAESNSPDSAQYYQLCIDRHHRRQLQTAGLRESFSRSGLPSLCHCLQTDRQTDRQTAKCWLLFRCVRIRLILTYINTDLLREILAGRMKGKRKPEKKRIQMLNDVLENKNYAIVKTGAEDMITWKLILKAYHNV